MGSSVGAWGDGDLERGNLGGFAQVDADILEEVVDPVVERLDTAVEGEPGVVVGIVLGAGGGEGGAGQFAVAGVELDLGDGAKAIGGLPT